MEVLWKHTVSVFCTFPEKFHTRKLGEITVFHAVNSRKAHSLLIMIIKPLYWSCKFHCIEHSLIWPNMHVVSNLVNLLYEIFKKEHHFWVLFRLTIAFQASLFILDNASPCADINMITGDCKPSKNCTIFSDSFGSFPVL